MCAVILPRLEAVTGQWQTEGGDDPLLRQHIEDARRLTVVLRFCMEKDIPLLFL